MKKLSILKKNDGNGSLAAVVAFSIVFAMMCVLMLRTSGARMAMARELYNYRQAGALAVSLSEVLEGELAKKEGEFALLAQELAAKSTDLSCDYKASCSGFDLSALADDISVCLDFKKERLHVTVKVDLKGNCRTIDTEYSIKRDTAIQFLRVLRREI